MCFAQDLVNRIMLQCKKSLDSAALRVLCYLEETSGENPAQCD